MQIISDIDALHSSGKDYCNQVLSQKIYKIHLSNNFNIDIIQDQEFGLLRNVISFDVMFIYETITIKTDKLRGAYKYTYIHVISF